MYLSKFSASVFSLLLLAAIAWPVGENWKPKPKDEFPLSYFPMFSFKREAVQELSYFVGYDAQNQRYCIPYDYIGSGGFNQVRRQLNKKVRRDKGPQLTEKVAKRLSSCRLAPYNELVRVDLVTGRYHLDNYFLTGDKNPLAETVIASKTIVKP
jgi:hypothetical protein